MTKKLDYVGGTFPIVDKPSWEDIFVRDFTTVDYSGADEFLHITGAYENIIKFLRQTIKEERGKTIKDIMEFFEKNFKDKRLNRIIIEGSDIKKTFNDLTKTL